MTKSLQQTLQESGWESAFHSATGETVEEARLRLKKAGVPNSTAKKQVKKTGLAALKKQHAETAEAMVAEGQGHRISRGGRP